MSTRPAPIKPCSHPSQGVAIRDRSRIGSLAALVASVRGRGAVGRPRCTMRPAHCTPPSTPRHPALRSPGTPGPHFTSNGVLSTCQTTARTADALYIGAGQNTIRRVDARTGHSVLLAGAINSICGIAVDHAGKIPFAGGTEIQVLAGRAGLFYGQAMRPGREYTIAGSAPRTATTRTWATTARPARPPTAGSPALPWTRRATS